MRDTIGMAREVKATAYTSRHYPDRTTYTFGPEQLKAFEALVRADEREASTIEDFKHRLASAIDAMPFGDTAASFAVFIRNFK